MPKEILYIDPKSKNRKQIAGYVKYLLLQNQCVFSGTSTYEEYTSTVNAVEHVLQALIQAENLDPRSTTFFDLQTSRVHTILGDQPFCLKRLILSFKDDVFEVIDWIDASCSPPILREFGLGG